SRPGSASARPPSSAASRARRWCSCSPPPSAAGSCATTPPPPSPERFHRTLEQTAVSPHFATSRSFTAVSATADASDAVALAQELAGQRVVVVAVGDVGGQVFAPVSSTRCAWTSHRWFLGSRRRYVGPV